MALEVRPNNSCSPLSQPHLNPRKAISLNLETVTDSLSRCRQERGNSYQTRRAQMTVPRSFFTLAFLSLFFLGLLVLGIPVSGFAQSPHSCLANLTGHQTSPLSRTSSFTFWFAKNCPPYTSATLSWKWSILRYSDNVQVCSGGPQAVPPTPISFQCNSLPVGQYVKVVIYYQTTSGGSWMSHSELFSN
jgi:hypothetical protein